MNEVKKEATGSYFTLLELLIVIAMIAILAGMLLPALNRARTTAQTVACTGQVKQLLTANIMYMGDFNDWIYPFFTDFYKQTWPRVLEPYLSTGKLETDRYKFSSQQTERLFSCPGDTHTSKGRKDNGDCSEDSCGGITTSRQSYGINFFFQKGVSPDRIGRKLSELMVKDSHGEFTLKSGSSTLYLTEVKWSTSNHYSATSLGCMDLLRHGGRNNIAFLDGSVRAYVSHSWISLVGTTESYFDQKSFYSKILKR